jgi:hypothetical protein
MITTATAIAALRRPWTLLMLSSRRATRRPTVAVTP